MQGPYGFDMSGNCETCRLRKDGFFCQMSPKATKAFDQIKSTSAYPERAVLFLQGQASRGVYVLCSGEVKLTISSQEGKTLILRFAKAGEILGLMAAVAGKPYEVTAETVRPCQIAFVRREDFMRFLTQNPEALPAVMRQLNANYLKACDQVRTLGLCGSAEERLARLLLGWADGAQETKAGMRLTVPLTHEEIAACIGSTRETVTRTLSQFKHRNLVTMAGSTMTIPNRQALESLAA